MPFIHFIFIKLKSIALLFTSSSAFVLYRLLNGDHSDSYEVVSFGSFISWIIYCVSIFSCVYWPSVFLLWRNVCLGLLPIFWLGCLFCCWVVKAVYVFWKLSTVGCIVCKYFLPFHRLSFLLFSVQKLIFCTKIL